MNIGSDINFMGSHKGTEPGKDYQWIASASSKYPDFITINQHPKWLEWDDNTIIRKLVKVCSHEPIHIILWNEKLEASDDYDIGRDLFLKMLKETMAVEELNEIGIRM